VSPGYQALREGAAWLDLSGRGKIRVLGEDRVRLLHAMTSNHVEQLATGAGCYAFFLSAQGRILGDANILRLEDHVLLDTEPETREKLYQHLDRFIIADDVTLEDATEAMATLDVEGPRAAEVLRAAGAPEPPVPHSSIAWGDGRIAGFTATGAAGWRIFLPAEEKPRWIADLEAAGATAAAAGEISAVRLENARPRYGEDIGEHQIVQETRLAHALHFSKGCYLGQEIVERVRSRGHVNRLLVHLHIESSQPPAPGTRLTAGGRETGEITSAAFSPALGKCVALGYVRTGDSQPGTRLEAGASAVEVTPLAPA